MFNEFVRFFWGQDSRAVLRLPAEPTCQVPIIRDISRGAAPRGDQGEPSRAGNAQSTRVLPLWIQQQIDL